MLANNSFPASFYTGDALGSFNSFTRFSTGLLAGLGIIWLTFPHMFQTRVYAQKVDEISYAKAIEQVQR